MSAVHLYLPVRPGTSDVEEVLRYMGMRGSAPEDVRELAQRAIAGLPAQPRACYKRIPAEVPDEEHVRLDGELIPSRSLARHLAGCTAAYLMAVTVGADVDRQISRYERFSPAMALAADAAGSAAVEVLADELNEYLAEAEAACGNMLRSRYSPGYGDFPLDYQEPMLRSLEAGKRLEMSLSEGLMLLPVKSVTAVIGVYRASES